MILSTQTQVCQGCHFGGYSFDQTSIGKANRLSNLLCLPLCPSISYIYWPFILLSAFSSNWTCNMRIHFAAPM